MALLEYLPYIIALSIACAIPGPGITASVGTALGGGFVRGLAFVTGIVLGDLCYLTFAVLGLTAIATAFAGIFTFVKFASAAYLLFLAWKFWKGALSPQAVSSNGARGLLSTLIGGLTLTLGNPKTIIFYVAILPTILDLNTIALNNYLVLAAITIIVLYAVCIPYIGLAARARSFLVDPKALKWLGRGAGSAMAGAALFVMARE